jgi:iron(III) transport system substrate-binding protein
MHGTVQASGDSRAIARRDNGTGAARRHLSRRRLTLRSVGLCAAASLLLAGCGGSDENGAGAEPVSGSWSDIEAAAAKEGKVTIYSGQGTKQLQDLASKFQQKYPKIKVEVVRGVETDFIPKVEAELRTGKGIADIVVVTDRAWMSANKANFEAPQGPAFDEPAFDRAEHLIEDTYFVTTAAVLTFAWNTKGFSGTVNDYPDLLDPALADGKIGIPPADGAARVDFYRYLEENYGEDFVKKLAAQRPRVYPSALPLAQALSSGEVAAATTVEPQVDEQKAGAPVEWGLAKPAWGARFHSALPKSGPHPNAAQVLADFMITREGQEAIARKAASVLPDIPGAVADMTEVRKSPIVTPDQVREYQEKWNELFQP